MSVVKSVALQRSVDYQLDVSNWFLHPKWAPRVFPEKQPRVNEDLQSFETRHGSNVVTLIVGWGVRPREFVDIVMIDWPLQSWSGPRMI